ncbi:DUF4381 domain-containing protein [Blastopirellula sp. JC732]|uniref:DUF4381 domain-containing protein n=1 Tax=Blastopirellula sediminis TaxID=2894196 RepID=A0A9X1MJC9_9BACT|nr:DUF4381 domain-containing protein [Blastopirellula sediminis]MCC9609050.1 DUF4381 domain-containing protein [Blastopirellula sediminis]MCC9628173.1 DUF4381 domain-containing protein [Blastopirellula sediminis]
MNDDPTSLDQLHEIVLPPPVPWFPLAPGWYVLFALLLALVVWGVCAAWKSWRANAYRRAALEQLKGCQTITAISETLRRTALAIAPRATIAPLVGEAWADWLASRADCAMPPEVRRQLLAGGYAPAEQAVDLGPLKSYAAAWITSHSPLPKQQG